MDGGYSLVIINVDCSHHILVENERKLINNGKEEGGRVVILESN